MKAFPITNTETQHAGMDLRDYFAAKAMQGIVAASGHKGGVDYDDWLVSKSAYLLADAMLEARKPK